MRLKLKLGDVLVILGIVLTAFFILVSTYEKNTIEKTAVITQNNIVLDRIRLDRVSEPYTINYGGDYPGTITVENGSIRFSHAECPDQVCVDTGWITRPGQIAVCIPAGVIIKIEGQDPDLDIIVK